MMSAHEQPSDSDDQWADAGFTPAQIATFREWRIPLEDARRWRRAGVDSGLDATRWMILKVAPDDVTAWGNQGVDLDTAFQWRQAGFTLAETKHHLSAGRDVGQARQHVDAANAARSQALARTMGSPGGVVLGLGSLGAGQELMQKAQQAGVDMQLLTTFMARQWLDDDAIEWASHGITADDAYHWIDLGLTASEAGRHARTGATIVDVMRLWWPTGIPFSELADWIGAGLDPDEASAQRNAGVTAQQAAALRALQRGGAQRPSPTRPTNPRWGPPPRGAPPADEDTARQAITDAFTAMNDVDETTGAIPTVEDSGGLGRCLDEVRQRFGPNFSATFTVDRIRFLDDDEALVAYTVTLTGGPIPGLMNRAGRAILSNGQWLVTRDTFCELMAMAGVTCPPRG